MSAAPASPRVWGRVYAEDGTYTWVPVTPAANGDQSALNLTWLIQVLLLNKGESPLNADWGIAGQQDVQTQTQPDNDVALTQQRFSQYFASLQVGKVSANPPTYNISAIGLSGAVYNTSVAR